MCTQKHKIKNFYIRRINEVNAQILVYLAMEALEYRKDIGRENE